MTPTLPVVVVTGALGAGKSTLVGRLLRDPRCSDTAVVINEFGEVPIDGYLVAALPGQVVEVTHGCLCCTMRGDIRDTLLRLHAAATLGIGPDFARVVVETTGLADPVPVIMAFLDDPRLARRFHLAAVVTVVDAIAGGATLTRRPEAVRQVALADCLVVTKGDLLDATPPTVGWSRLCRRLGGLNPRAAILDAQSPTFDVTDLISPAPGDADAPARAIQGPFSGRHDHHRHGDGIAAFTIGAERSLPLARLERWIGDLLRQCGTHLLRLKGLVQIAEHPERPLLVQAVGHVSHHNTVLPRWPVTPPRTELVMIGDGLDPAVIHGLRRDLAD